MAIKTAEQIAQKYQRRVAGASQDYQDGITNPSRSWSEATQAAEETWQAGVQEAAANRSFSRGAQRAGDEKWRRGALEKGAARYTQAAPQAAQNFAAVANDVMGAAEAARQAAARQPGTTYEQRKQKALAAMDATRDYWRRRKGQG